jgi:hypothetical protein
MHAASVACVSVNTNLTVSLTALYMQSPICFLFLEACFFPDAYSTIGSNALFSIDPNTGDILVNSALISQNLTTYTIVVRATSNGHYAQTPLAGCQCSNRSDVVVNIQVTSLLNTPLKFTSDEYDACKYTMTWVMIVSCNKWTSL